MMRGTAIVWIAAALAMPQCAWAAGQQDMQRIDAKAVAFNIYNYTDCIVQAEGRSAKFGKMLRMMPGDPQFVPAYIKTIGDECSRELSRLPSLTVEMKSDPTTMRDLLFGALYRREFKKSGPPAGLAAVPPLSLSSEFDGDVTAIGTSYRVRRAFGDCIARHDPKAANDLIIAKPYSNEESAAIDSLKPLLGACIPDGQTVRLTRDGLREDLGEAMYELAVAARDVPPAG